VEKVYIFDTTLRDGEQSPGVALTTADKIEIARQLEKLGVDIIEAGFPKTSPGDFEAVQTIAREVRGCQIAGLAHANMGAVDACWEAVKDGAQPRIHVFLSSSDIHIMHQLVKDKETVLEMARTMVARAAGYCSDVEFSPMDATRSDREYVYTMLEQCIAAGATTVNIPDTVGYAIPNEFGQFIKDIFEHVPNIHKARISVHCHNDLGLASANSLAAVQNGARQIETCINGIGERAGNASLEEVVMAIKTRRDFLGVETGIRRIGKAVSSALADVPVGPHAPLLVLENSAGGGDGLGGTVEELAAIFEAIAQREGGKPFMLVAKTTKGKGVSYMENVPIWHYRSPNKDEYRKAVDELEAAR